MRKEIIEEYKRVEALIGEPVNKEVVAKSSSIALAQLIKQGMPREMVERMLRSARPLGDFAWFQKRMPFDDFNSFFGGPVRKFGLDGSREGYSYGASTIAEILNISPYKSSVDTYENMRGKKEKNDPEKDEIFYAGHMIEPVYRDYFRHMYGSRYEVFDCDIQWESRKYAHFVGNVDGLLYDKETGQFGVLEIKHTTDRNVKTKRAVQSGEAPAHWDVQERAYLELLDLDFACLFLGWGNRPGLDTNAMCRTERDPELGESILTQCEDFMEYNVEAGIKPSFKNVRNAERVKKSVEEIYGPVDPKKKSITFDKKFKKNLEELVTAKEKIEKAKEEKKKAEEKVEAAQEEYDALTLPLVEELKTAPKGEFIDDDGVHYEVSYDVRKALNIEKIMNDYPDIYDEVNKPAVDTQTLKRKYPQVYEECREEKLNAQRSISIRKWEAK